MLLFTSLDYRNLKLDMKAVATAVGTKCEFESPEAIKERFGLNEGGVPPFRIPSQTRDMVRRKNRRIAASRLQLRPANRVDRHEIERSATITQPKMGAFTKE